MRRKPKGLGITVPCRFGQHDELAKQTELSYRVTDTTFRHDKGLVISEKGSHMQQPGDKASLMPGDDLEEEPENDFLVKGLKELSLGEIVGRGQSSYVQKALHNPSKTEVVVKVLNIYEQAKRHQVIKELTTLFNNQSEYLVGFKGAFFDSCAGNIMVALELMEFGSLHDIQIAVKKIPEPVLGKITIEVLKGLDYLHSHKRVHRDIKPHNICVNKRGKAKLTDFGLTTELKTSFADCKTMCGTYSYMSPERITSDRYNAKCDVWGLGITLYECASGRFPYPQSGVYIDLIQRIVNEPVPQLKDVKFSPQMLDFLERCLDKDQDKRMSVEQLLKHPWIRAMENTDFDLAKWLNRKLKEI